MQRIEDLKIKIFADGANLGDILELSKLPYIKGFTTNPSLMRKAGVVDYEAFARDLIALVPDKPISFEVFADDFPSMIAQGRKIASWGKNVNVKVPITTTNSESTGLVIQALASEGVVVNVTAVFTLDQVKAIIKVLDPKVTAIVSVFAGRIADTGVDPTQFMRDCVYILNDYSSQLHRLLWASPREVLNIFQADQVGCHIITCTSDLLAKLSLAGKDLTEYSLETVRMFHKDARASAFSIN